MVVEGHGELKLETFLKNIEIPINKLEPFVSYRYLLLLFIPGQRLLNIVCDAVNLQSLAAHQRSPVSHVAKWGGLERSPWTAQSQPWRAPGFMCEWGKLVTRGL
jgi:hypothetical protein